MQEQQKMTYFVNSRPTAQSINHLSSSKKLNNYHHKFKTEAVDEYQALHFQKMENFQKRPNFNLPQQELKKKHCITKPIKNKFNQVYMKARQEEIQNCTTEEKSTNNQFFLNFEVRRSGSAALNRNRFISDTNKQNNLNQEEKHQNEQNPKWKNMINQSISAIFDHKGSQQKHPIKSSQSLMRVRSKQHLIFCSNRLPKDFFGESILGENYSNGHQQKFIFGSHGCLASQQRVSKRAQLKPFLRGSESRLKPMFDQIDQKGQKLSFEQEFTFRKEKSKKNLDQYNDTAEQTPRFMHKRQATQGIRKNQSLPSLHKNMNLINFLEAKKKLHRNLSRHQLKL